MKESCSRGLSLKVKIWASFLIDKYAFLSPTFYPILLKVLEVSLFDFVALSLFLKNWLLLLSSSLLSSSSCLPSSCYFFSCSTPFSLLSPSPSVIFPNVVTFSTFFSSHLFSFLVWPWPLAAIVVVFLLSLFFFHKSSFFLLDKYFGISKSKNNLCK